MKLDEDFWSQKYKEGNTGWDIGEVSRPLKEYFDQLVEKGEHYKILVPGAGNGYEARYLYDLGFQGVHILDFSRTAIDNFISQNSNFPVANIHIEDFFEHHGTYDLIVEQTFFCAIDPKLRKDYVLKMHSLLKEDGILVGVLWDDPMNSDRPPFGGDKEEYQQLFEAYFVIEKLETCYNSIQPRQGREVFVRLRKKVAN